MKAVFYHKSYLLALGLFLLMRQASAQSILDNTQLRMFTHGEYSAARDSSKKFTHRFEAEGIELLLTSQVTDRISLLSEVFLSTEGHVDFDRIVVKYQLNDYLHLSMGKVNTPIGIWNNAFYHQARVLTPTVDHPLALTDGDEGGLIELHDVGVQAGGDNITNARLGYRLFVGNGYGNDGTKLKSVTYNVFTEPVDNLKFALSGQHENIPAGATTPQGIVLSEQTNFNVYNASVLYFGGTKPYEFGAEYYVFNTTTASTGLKASDSYFVYAGYKLKNKVTPYVSYNSASYKRGENFFVNNNYSNTTVGVRYNFSPLSVIKTELQIFNTDETSKWQRLEVQWAIGF